MMLDPAHWAARLRSLQLRWRAENAAVAAEVARANVARLRWLLPAMVLLNLLHMWAFRQPGAGDAAVVVAWKQHILHTHTAMALIATALTALAWGLHRRSSQAPAVLWGLCAPLAAAAALAFAGLLACIDQLVTPSITPFVMAGVMVATVVQQRPAVAALMYAAALAGFAWGLGLTQPDPQLLLSNRVNALTAVVLGWLLGSINWRRTATTVLLGRALAQRQAELEAQQRELQRLATRDGLTGLLNRAEMQRLSAHELALASRHRLPVSLLLIDLDHFKRVNDRWGHPTGDAVLVACAERLSAGVRHSDLVARLGGEEFMLLLPHTGPQAAARLADKLRRRLAEPVCLADGRSVQVTASVGLVACEEGRGTDFESLYQRADQALYRAKAQGRDRVAQAA